MRGFIMPAHDVWGDESDGEEGPAQLDREWTALRAKHWNSGCDLAPAAPSAISIYLVSFLRICIIRKLRGEAHTGTQTGARASPCVPSLALALFLFDSHTSPTQVPRRS